MGNIAQSLETQRMRYEEQFRVGVENHNEKTDTLRRRTQEAEMKVKQSHTALRRLKRLFNNEISKVTRENEQLKHDMANVAGSEISRR
jgi:hypothetical protein